MRKKRQKHVCKESRKINQKKKKKKRVYKGWQGKEMANSCHLSDTETCSRRAINIRRKSKLLLALQNQGWCFFPMSVLQKAFINQTLLY